MYMHITESEECLEYSGGMSIYLLYAIEATLRHISRESGDLLYADDTRIRDDDDIEFVIDPIKKDKSEKHNPVD
jgi:hypothetical protein